MDRFISVLLRLSSTPFLVVSTVVFAVFLVQVLPDQAQQSKQYSADVGSPDTMLYYTPQTLYNIAEAYTEDGRHLYVQARYRFDIIWPLVYTLFLISAIGRLTLILWPVPTPGYRLTLVPILGLLSDYIENILVTLVMIRYPMTTPIADVASGIVTLLKWLLVNGSFLILIILLMWQMIRLIQLKMAE